MRVLDVHVDDDRGSSDRWKWWRRSVYCERYYHCGLGVVSRSWTVSRVSSLSPLPSLSLSLARP